MDFHFCKCHPTDPPLYLLIQQNRLNIYSKNIQRSKGTIGELKSNERI